LLTAGGGEVGEKSKKNKNALSGNRKKAKRRTTNQVIGNKLGSSTRDTWG